MVKFVHVLSLRISLTIHQIIKSSEIFEFIPMDTVYSADTSIHGNKYFFTIFDDYSR